MSSNILYSAQSISSINTGPEHDVCDGPASNVSQVQQGASVEADNDQALADDNDTDFSVQVTLARSPRQFNGTILMLSKLIKNFRVAPPPYTACTCRRNQCS